MSDVWRAIEAHRTHQTESGLLVRRREQFHRLAVRTLVNQVISARLDNAWDTAEVKSALAMVDAGQSALADVSGLILEKVLAGGGQADA